MYYGRDGTASPDPSQRATTARAETRPGIGSRPWGGAIFRWAEIPASTQSWNAEFQQVAELLGNGDDAVGVVVMV